MLKENFFGVSDARVIGIDFSRNAIEIVFSLLFIYIMLDLEWDKHSNII